MADVGTSRPRFRAEHATVLGPPRPQRCCNANREAAPVRSRLVVVPKRLRRPLYRNRVGHISVRHICADGEVSKPRPSFGCLKLRPTMSTKSSRLTLAFGSNE